VTPYYADDLVTLYHGDAREIAPMLPRDLSVVGDPPYGMRWDGRVSSGRGSNSVVGSRSWSFGRTVTGDDKPFDPTPWLNYPQVILWGANHYGQQLPRGTTLIWVKRRDEAFGSFLSDAEIAWQKGGHGVYCRRDIAYKTSEQRFHPTQKPIGVMRWCVGRTTGTVFDPYCGSGSTLVAAKSLQRRAIGIEIDERYCEIAAERCRQEVLGLVA
jgi:site-specific DNA-methyltransferase (adenine-specific)